MCIYSIAIHVWLRDLLLLTDRAWCHVQLSMLWEIQGFADGCARTYRTYLSPSDPITKHLNVVGPVKIKLSTDYTHTLTPSGYLPISLQNNLRR
jgi:hypothetical protein